MRLGGCWNVQITPKLTVASPGLAGTHSGRWNWVRALERPAFAATPPTKTMPSMRSGGVLCRTLRTCDTSTISGAVCRAQSFLVLFGGVRLKPTFQVAQRFHESGADVLDRAQAQLKVLVIRGMAAGDQRQLAELFLAQDMSYCRVPYPNLARAAPLKENQLPPSGPMPCNEGLPSGITVAIHCDNKGRGKWTGIEPVGSVQPVVFHHEHHPGIC